MDMSKKNVDVEDATVVEEVKDVQEAAEVREPMDEPKTVNYEQMFAISDAFVNDLKTTLGSLPYVTANPFIRFVEAKKDKIAIAEVNELISKLRTLPYEKVYKLMRNIENEEIVNKYFIPVQNEGK